MGKDAYPDTGRRATTRQNLCSCHRTCDGVQTLRSNPGPAPE